MKSVLISIRPEWCVKIASGEKTVEVRKTRPELESPFRVYVYCCSIKAMSLRPYVELHAHTNGLIDVWGGKVFASFVCDRVDTLVPASEPYSIYDVSDDYVLQTCLANGALWDYGNGVTLYGWHISDLRIYNRPRDLGEFTGLRMMKNGFDLRELDRPPQSWCYVRG